MTFGSVRFRQQANCPVWRVLFRHEGAKVPPPAATSSRRPTKAGAQTPATRAPLGQSHHARPRSTKAGARAPATPIRKLCSHGNNLHAQRRPERKLRRHPQDLSLIHAWNHDAQLADGVAHTRKCAGGSCASIVAFPNPISLDTRPANGKFRISGGWHARTAAPMPAIPLRPGRGNLGPSPESGNS